MTTDEIRARVNKLSKKEYDLDYADGLAELAYDKSWMLSTIKALLQCDEVCIGALEEIMDSNNCDCSYNTLPSECPHFQIDYDTAQYAISSRNKILGELK